MVWLKEVRFDIRRSKKLVGMAVALMMTALIHGCSSGEFVSEQSVAEKVANVRVGTTTMARIEELFGKEHYRDDHLWVYNLSDTSFMINERKAGSLSGVIPIMPTVAATNTRALITVRFNDAGVVKGFEVSRYFSAPFTNDSWYLLREPAKTDLKLLAEVAQTLGLKTVSLDDPPATLVLGEESKAKITIRVIDGTLHLASINPHDRLSNAYRVFVKRESALASKLSELELIQ